MKYEKGKNLELDEIMICNYAINLMNDENFDLYFTKKEEGKQKFYLEDLELGVYLNEVGFNLSEVLNSLNDIHQLYIYNPLSDPNSIEGIDYTECEKTSAKFLNSVEVNDILKNIDVEKFVDILVKSDDIEYNNLDCRNYIKDMLDDKEKDNEMEVL